MNNFNINKNSELHLAYLIHTTNYRETSLLVDFFTQTDGFITAVAKGVRTSSSSRGSKRGLFQAFTKLWIGYRGKSDLVNLNVIEFAEQPPVFNINQIKVCFYINELLYYLCKRPAGIVYPNLFEIYENTLLNLKKLTNITDITDITGLDYYEPFLREFELDLLSSIGYGLLFDNINPELNYGYDFADGFYIIEFNNFSEKLNKKLSLRGDLIINIMQRNWADKETLVAAKKLLRSIIKYHIGNKQLHSRKLFV